MSFVCIQYVCFPLVRAMERGLASDGGGVEMNRTSTLLFHNSRVKISPRLAVDVTGVPDTDLPTPARSGKSSSDVIKCVTSRGRRKLRSFSAV